jgi:CDP-glycerol glycerophosphotransferase (TagB/SpsB family)
MESIDGFDYENNIYKSLEKIKPDIVFYQQPWYMIHSQIPEVVSKYALTCIISYGFTSIDTQSWGSEAIRKNSGNLWKMFAESEYHNKFYQKAAELKHKDIMVTKGYPKLDNYRMPIDQRFEDLWKDSEKEEKHRIIWAPHHSIEKYGFEMSNFKEQYLYFLELAKKHPEYNFVVKPHPSLRYKCITEKFLTEKEYDDYIAEWNSLGNAVVYTDGNYFDIFKTSDVLITDSSSFLAEYFYSGKPIIFFESPNRAGFNKFGLKIKKGFYTLAKTEDTEELLYKLLIKKEDKLKTLRAKIIKQEFYYPESGIGKNIVNYLKKQTERL